MKRKTDLLLIILPLIIMVGLLIISFVNPHKADTQIEQLNKAGMAAYQKHDYNTAINDLEQVVDSNRDTKTRMILAKCYYETKQYDAAKHHFGSVLSDESNKLEKKDQKIIDEANSNLKLLDKIIDKK